MLQEPSILLAWRWIADGSGAQVIIWVCNWHRKWGVGGQSYRTEPSTWEIWHCLQINSVRIKLNCRIPSWCLENCLLRIEAEDVCVRGDSSLPLILWNWVQNCYQLKSLKHMIIKKPFWNGWKGAITDKLSAVIKQLQRKLGLVIPSNNSISNISIRESEMLKKKKKKKKLHTYTHSPLY